MSLNIANELVNSGVSKELIDSIRQDTIKVFENYCTPVAAALQKEVQSSQSIIEIDKSIDVNENFLSGYLLATEDIARSSLASIADFEVILLFEKEKLLAKIAELLLLEKCLNSNAISSKLKVDQEQVSRLLGSNRILRCKLFHVYKEGCNNRYSLSRLGEAKYRAYKEAQRQIRFSRYSKDLSAISYLNQAILSGSHLQDLKVPRLAREDRVFYCCPMGAEELEINEKTLREAMK